MIYYLITGKIPETGKDVEMAYADFGTTRKSGSRLGSGLSPVGLGGAFIITGGMVAMLAFLSPDFVRSVKDSYGSINAIAPTQPKVEVLDKDPPVKSDPVPPPMTRTDRTSFAAPPPPLPLSMVPPVDAPPVPPVPEYVPEPKKPDPLPAALPQVQPTPRAIVKTGVRPDPRYARALQPDYPMSMRRAGIEGRVTVRVLIGTDGRVKDVALVQSPDPAFYETTRRHALDNWRFKPATVDGEAVEAWFQMNLVFKLNDS
jgi:periplasmic protein TonB